MKIIFFGNGDFSLYSLKSIHNSSHEILLVVTNNSKRVGRGLKKENNSITKYCMQNNLNLFQTNNPNNNESVNYLSKYISDLYVVVEYKILTIKVFKMPKIGTINIHASLLPKYRGSAPIQRALMNGDTQIGLTSFFINKNIDSGNIIATSKIKIDDKISYGECYHLLGELSERLLNKTFINIKKNKPVIKQDIKAKSLAPKISKNECRISFNIDAKSLHNKIRALTPLPGAYCYINNKRVKIFNTYYNYNLNNLSIGEFIFSNDKLYIGCKKGSLSVKELQFESKKLINSSDFKNMQNFKNLKFK